MEKNAQRADHKIPPRQDRMAQVDQAYRVATIHQRRPRTATCYPLTRFAAHEHRSQRRPGIWLSV